MDETLKELKKHREETEGRFRALLEQMDSERRRLRNESARIRKSLDGIPDFQGKEMLPFLESMVALLEGCLSSQEHLAQGLREMMALDNARSAELARQLTVLPLERMDLILGEFEKRLESLETKLDRLQKE